MQEPWSVFPAVLDRYDDMLDYVLERARECGVPDKRQLRMAGSVGYDPSCPIDYVDGGLKKMAYAESDKTGITLTAYTTQPGVQFYAGNYLDGKPLGKNGTAFLRRSGFCLESQYFPNALEHPEFAQPLLKKGELWKAQTVYVIGKKA